MNIQVTSEIPWSPSEASSINDFLSKPTGRKWLELLQKRKPKMDLSTTEKAALSGAFAAGYEAVFLQIAATRDAQAQPDNASIKSIDPTKD